MNLNSIEKKLRKIGLKEKNTAAILAYNFGEIENIAEILFLAGIKPTAAEVKKEYDFLEKNANNKYWGYFDKLTEREKKYYASVECLRGKAVKIKIKLDKN